MLYLIGKFLWGEIGYGKAQFFPFYFSSKPAASRAHEISAPLGHVVRLQIKFLPSGDLVLPEVKKANLPNSEIHIWKAQYPTDI